MKVDIVETEEGPSYGGAILAAVACGEFANVEQAAENLIHIVDTVEPEPELAAAYEKRYQTFAKLYPQIKGLFKIL